MHMHMYMCMCGVCVAVRACGWWWGAFLLKFNPTVFRCLLCPVYPGTVLHGTQLYTVHVEKRCGVAGAAGTQWRFRLAALGIVCSGSQRSECCEPETTQGRPHLCRAGPATA